MFAEPGLAKGLELWRKAVQLSDDSLAAKQVGKVAAGDEIKLRLTGLG